MAGTSVPYWALVVEVALAAPPLHLGCERCYAGEAWNTMGEQTPVSVSAFSTFLLLFCYSVVVCVAFVTFLLLFKVILL